MLPFILTSSLVFAISSLALGSLWYGPLLFGKRWMRLMGVDPTTLVVTKEMKKESMVLYGIQFALSLLQGFVTTILFMNTVQQSATFSENYLMMLVVASVVFIGFLFPTLAGACLWTGEKPASRMERFLIQAGYQLLLLSVFPALFLGVLKVMFG